MNIEKARRLKVGDTVSCPADRGTPAFIGTVSHIQADAPASKNIHGDEYIWINVRAGGNPAGVWPSNRLG